MTFNNHDGEKLRITSAGNIGIGTDTSGFATRLIVGTGSGETGNMTLFSGTSSSSYIHFADGNSGADRYRGYVTYQHSDNSMLFGTNDVERFRITSIGNIGISSTVPKTDLDISQKTGAVALPQGTTAQRPSGSAPYIRKNTTNNALEYFDGTSWVEIITDYFPTGSTILG